VNTSTSFGVLVAELCEEVIHCRWSGRWACSPTTTSLSPGDRARHHRRGERGLPDLPPRSQAPPATLECLP